MSDRAEHYRQEDFDGEKPPCDLVMKGGITSGTVYPLAVVEIAKAYRLSNVGGTSAGALAAAITAAAEFTRESGGYLRIAEIPEEIGSNLLRLFQPTPRLRPLFNMLVAALGADSKVGKVLGALWAAVRGYPIVAVVVPLIVLVVGIAVLPAGGWTAFVVFFSVVLALVLLGWRLARAFTRDLPAERWGICRGLTDPGEDFPALTDWLADKIDGVAGRDPTMDPPLTFGDLRHRADARPINLEVMTTNLSMRRPYRLPFHENIYLFRDSEMREYFPARIVDHMINNTTKFEKKNGPTRHDDFHHFPEGDALPIVVAARMSLSFPGLIAAVPLWTRDFTLKEQYGGDPEEPVQCWFSDGGLSSNFPVHFFDHLWPNAPTFAIALEDYVRERQGDARVRLPSTALEGILLPVHPITSLGGFIMTLLNAAKDWQDNLQSVLPGYRERVLRIALQTHEGGLNLTMGKETIDTLVGYGREAGQKARSEFDLDEHRWRRFLVAMDRIEETLDELKQAYETPPQGSFSGFLRRYPGTAKSYKPEPPWLDGALRRAEKLVELAGEWQASPRIREGKIPRPSCDLRITPQQ